MLTVPVGAQWSRHQLGTSVDVLPYWPQKDTVLGRRGRLRQDTYVSIEFCGRREFADCVMGPALAVIGLVAGCKSVTARIILHYFTQDFQCHLRRAARDDEGGC